METNEKIRPIGVVAVALRAVDAPRGAVIGAWAVSAVALAIGVLTLFQ